jgi:hypothetical protein
MRLTRIFLVAIILASGAASLHAWYTKGHRRACDLAVRSLPKEMPEFFRNGLDLMNGVVHDPDLFTRPVAPPQLHDVEALNHYFDLEPLGEDKLPLTRYEFLEIVYRKKLQPSKVGLLPYAVVECTERLSVVFAEYREHPEDKVIQTKCLLYAAQLAHYAQDLCQPLHTTIDYDGRAKADGSSPHSGIHAKIDRMIGQLADSQLPLPAAIKPHALTTPPREPRTGVSGSSSEPRTGVSGSSSEPRTGVSGSSSEPRTGVSGSSSEPRTGVSGLSGESRPDSAKTSPGKPEGSGSPHPKSKEDFQAHRKVETARAQELMDAVMAELHRSHDLVDKVYAMEKDLPADWKAPLPPNVQAFARERLERASQFTADLFMTAWQDSQFIEFPQWYRGGE